jgi:hypothetical protein
MSDATVVPWTGTSGAWYPTVPKIAESSSSIRRTPPRSMSLSMSPTWMRLSGLKSQ